MAKKVQRSRTLQINIAIQNTEVSYSRARLKTSLVLLTSIQIKVITFTKLKVDFSTPSVVFPLKKFDQIEIESAYFNVDNLVRRAISIILFNTTPQLKELHRSMGSMPVSSGKSYPVFPKLFYYHSLPSSVYV